MNLFLLHIPLCDFVIQNTKSTVMSMTMSDVKTFVCCYQNTLFHKIYLHCRSGPISNNHVTTNDGTHTRLDEHTRSSDPITLPVYMHEGKRNGHCNYELPNLMTN